MKKRKGSPSTWFYSEVGKENHDRIFCGKDIVRKVYPCGQSAENEADLYEKITGRISVVIGTTDKE